MEGLFGQRRFGRSTGEQLPISFSTSLAWPHLILSYLLYSTLLYAASTTRALVTS